MTDLEWFLLAASVLYLAAVFTLVALCLSESMNVTSSNEWE